MISWMQDERCGVALDFEHDPVVITTWHGAPGVELVDRYFRWSDATAAAAMAAEQQLVHVVDLRRATLPAAEVRKRVLEHSVVDLMGEVSLASVIVLGGYRMEAVVRAASMPALVRGGLDLFVVEDIDEGLELALMRLREARIPPPAGLIPGRYQAPSPSC